jgi:hypothetical protein
MRDRHADGVLIAFVVDDVDAECARLEGEGVAITTPLQTEPWGERFFQVTDPNGVVIQFVQWMTDPMGQASTSGFPVAQRIDSSRASVPSPGGLAALAAVPV